MVDAWAYEGPDGQIERVDISTVRDGEVDRWEYYEDGVMVRMEEDASGDGRVDKWKTYEDGSLISAAFDEDGNGYPDRRLTYGKGGRLLTIESDPDAAGTFTQKIAVEPDQ